MDYTSQLKDAYLEGEEVIAKCPKCKDYKYRLGINVKKDQFNCFNCKWGEGKLVSEVFPSLYKKLIGQFKSKKDIDKPRTSTEIQIPGFRYFNGLTPQEQYKYGTYLNSRGITYARAEHLKCGISRQHRLSDRVIFPLVENGVIVFYVARSIEVDPVIKEISPPKSVAYKGDFLYGIDEVGNGDMVCITEGIFDKEAVLRAGYLAVAALGSKLTDVQVGKLLAKHPSHLVILFDGDKDGRIGAVKALDKFIKRGFYQIRFAPLPDYTDPASLSKDVIQAAIEA